LIQIKTSGARASKTMNTGMGPPTLVNGGVYLWKVEQTKKTFISWADFFKDDKIGDFDVYVDVKMLDAAPGDVCSGLIFRMSPQGWDQGGYYYALSLTHLQRSVITRKRKAGRI